MTLPGPGGGAVGRGGAGAARAGPAIGRREGELPEERDGADPSDSFGDREGGPGLWETLGSRGDGAGRKSRGIRNGGIEKGLVR